MLPPAHVRGSNTVETHAGGYLQEYGFSFYDDLRHACCTLNFLANNSCRERTLRVHACAADCIPTSWTEHYINVAGRGVDATCPRLYEKHDRDVTGVRLEVQAKVCSQHVAIHVIADAVSSIESHQLEEFAFVCEHGTHRSVACACLIAALVYGNAEIVLTTRRTCTSGKQWLCECSS